MTFSSGRGYQFGSTNSRSALACVREPTFGARASLAASLPPGNHRRSRRDRRAVPRAAVDDGIGGGREIQRLLLVVTPPDLRSRVLSGDANDGVDCNECLRSTVAGPPPGTSIAMRIPLFWGRSAPSANSAVRLLASSSKLVPAPPGAGCGRWRCLGWPVSILSLPVHDCAVLWLARWAQVPSPSMTPPYGDDVANCQAPSRAACKFS
jgi:hypothetical protein